MRPLLRNPYNKKKMEYFFLWKEEEKFVLRFVSVITFFNENIKADVNAWATPNLTSDFPMINYINIFLRRKYQLKIEDGGVYWW